MKDKGWRKVNQRNHRINRMTMNERQWLKVKSIWQQPETVEDNECRSDETLIMQGITRLTMIVDGTYSHMVIAQK